MMSYLFDIVQWLSLKQHSLEEMWWLSSNYHPVTVLAVEEWTQLPIKCCMAAELTLPHPFPPSVSKDDIIINRHYANCYNM